MIRQSEVVLPGHPDKLCDAVAEAIVQAALAVDPDAYGQVEVAVWDREMWMTGGIVTRTRVPKLFEEIARETVKNIGYRGKNAFLASELEIRCSVCYEQDDPKQYTHHTNDQCIAVGWAGYDERVDFLPPEHFMAREFAQALFDSFRKGQLKEQGPDGKLLVRIREDQEGWTLEHVLTTVQQLEETSFFDLAAGVQQVLEGCYQSLRRADRRWRADWQDVQLMINPNGPLVEGGPLSDNGQTGRKLVMDYYGPRVPIGGGAIYGKDPRHIDRASTTAARQAAVEAVKGGAQECLVRLCYAPNVPTPLDVQYEMVGRGPRREAEWFNHADIGARDQYCSGAQKESHPL